MKKEEETKRQIERIKDKIESLEGKKTSIKSTIIDDMPKGNNVDNILEVLNKLHQINTKKTINDIEKEFKKYL